MGIAGKLLGLVFAVSGFLILWWGMGTNDALSLLYSFIGMFVMAMGFALLTSGRQQKEEKPPPPTVTEIRCSSCDFKEIRDFQKGDYVLKAVEATCPKCQGAMTIEGVYMVREDTEDKDRI
ncbi:MAG: hypothetical protein AM325_011265 [Candidatus Thorarchaeota archaeon SMTZ1-45]